MPRKKGSLNVNKKAEKADLKLALALSKSIEDEKKAVKLRKRKYKEKPIPYHLMHEQNFVNEMVAGRLGNRIIKDFNIYLIHKGHENNSSRIWDKTTLYNDIAPGNLSFNDINVTEKMMFYVEALMPPIEPTDVRQGDKIVSMSTIPGRESSFIYSPIRALYKELIPEVKNNVMVSPTLYKTFRLAGTPPSKNSDVNRSTNEIKNSYADSSPIKRTDSIKADSSYIQSEKKKESRYFKMFNNSLFSDMFILLKSGQILNLHKFIFASWNCDIDKLKDDQWFINDIEDIVAIRIFKHLYSDGAENIDDLLETEEGVKICNMFGINHLNLVRYNPNQISVPNIDEFANESLISFSDFTQTTSPQNNISNQQINNPIEPMLDLHCDVIISPKKHSQIAFNSNANSVDNYNSSSANIANCSHNSEDLFDNLVNLSLSFNDSYSDVEEVNNSFKHRPSNTISEISNSTAATSENSILQNNDNSDITDSISSSNPNKSANEDRTSEVNIYRDKSPLPLIQRLGMMIGDDDKVVILNQAASVIRSEDKIVMNDDDDDDDLVILDVQYNSQPKQDTKKYIDVISKSQEVSKIKSIEPSNSTKVKKRKSTSTTNSKSTSKKNKLSTPPVSTNKFNPFSPMPAFDKMTTPEIKRISSQSGLKPKLSKKQHIAVLKRIHELTHQVDNGQSTSTDDDDSSIDVGKVGVVPACEHVDNNTQLPFTQASNPFNDRAEKIMLYQLNDRADIYLFLKCNYFREILTFKPLFVDKLLNELQLNGIEIDKKQLKDYLDYQCINYDESENVGDGRNFPKPTKKMVL